MGSSPLTRGKPPIGRARRRRPGLIPAHAGKTTQRPCPLTRSTAHPRSRGENLIPGCLIAPGAGSSPLTRGKQSIRSLKPPMRGLIPAHAGKTMKRNRRTSAYRAHPRSRGENHGGRSWVLRSPGSSPLTRGKHRRARPRGRRLGLIPAHAGKTNGRSRGHRRFRAHPRSRGENTAQASPYASASGSSPLTRGKLCDLIPILRRQRLIPAHAGKTSSLRRW